MDIDFPLILMVATVATGLIALADKVWFARQRAARVAALEERLAPVAELAAAEKEPFLIEQGKSFFPVLAIVFVLRSFIAEPFQIPSGSMEPGLVKGDLSWSVNFIMVYVCRCSAIRWWPLMNPGVVM